jgi:hypothetical protein
MVRGYNPVKSDMREGAEMAFWQYARLKTTPCLAIASKLGVFTSGCPLYPKTLALCWSLKSIITLGLALLAFPAKAEHTVSNDNAEKMNLLGNILFIMLNYLIITLKFLVEVYVFTFPK